MHFASLPSPMSFGLLPTPSADSFAAGFAICASLIVAIGAQNAFVLRQGLRRQHVGLIVATCIALDIALMSAGVLGLDRLAAPHPWLLQARVVAGAAFLLAYGWSAARRAWSPSTLSLDAGRGAPVPSAGRVLAQTLALTLLNPHVYVDAVLLVGAVGAQQPAGAQVSFLVGTAVASASWFCLLGFGARWLAPLFARPQAWRWLDGVIAVTMWGLAAMLLSGLAAGGAALAWSVAAPALP